TFEQQAAEMFRCQNLRTISVNFSVADAHLVYPVHQFRNEIKSKTGRAEGSDLLLGRENHLSVFNRVLEIILLHSLGTKIQDRHRLSINTWLQPGGYPMTDAGSGLNRFRFCGCEHTGLKAGVNENIRPSVISQSRADASNAQVSISRTRLDRQRRTASPVKMISASQIKMKVMRCPRVNGS